jgi:plasmid replication initiation protein
MGRGHIERWRRSGTKRGEPENTEQYGGQYQPAGDRRELALTVPRLTPVLLTHPSSIDRRPF